MWNWLLQRVIYFVVDSCLQWSMQAAVVGAVSQATRNRPAAIRLHAVELFDRRRAPWTWINLTRPRLSTGLRTDSGNVFLVEHTRIAVVVPGRYILCVGSSIIAGSERAFLALFISGRSYSKGNQTSRMHN